MLPGETIGKYTIEAPLGAGGQAGLSHTLAEWYDPKGRDSGLKRALLVMLGMVNRES